MAGEVKHPKGLKVLFFTEMWERFSYYGMRALLVLYLTSKMINGGFELGRANALEIYAIFTSLVYLTPIIGGYLADRFLGQRKAIYIGALLMALGQFSLAFSEFGSISLRNEWLYMGLGLLIIGNGFFKPNISSIVGKLYSEDDPRKDSAFTIFYMGINLGALASPLIAGLLGEKFGWYLGFTTAGIGMLVSTLWFYFQREHLGTIGLPQKLMRNNPSAITLIGRDRIDIMLYVVLSVIGLYGFLNVWGKINESLQSNSLKILALIGISALIYVITSNTKGKNEWSRVFVIIVLCFFNVFFWSGFEQAGGTFNLFAAENTNLSTFIGTIPASFFQSVNPLLIILLAPIFSVIWLRLASMNKNPRTPVKFGIALLLVGLGFVVMSMAVSKASGGALVSPFWLLTVYFIHTTGELCLSPIGLSMISKLSPQKIVSVMMGVWFASIALAQYLAGVLEAILHNHLPDMPLYLFLTITSVSGGIVLLAISPILNRMMKGIH
jgi:POT family proton-dependent oligopeptide transporter